MRTIKFADSKGVPAIVAMVTKISNDRPDVQLSFGSIDPENVDGLCIAEHKILNIEALTGDSKYLAGVCFNSEEIGLVEFVMAEMGGSIGELLEDNIQEIEKLSFVVKDVTLEFNNLNSMYQMLSIFVKIKDMLVPVDKKFHTVYTL